MTSTGRMMPQPLEVSKSNVSLQRKPAIELEKEVQYIRVR
jgi:hypothetical protein